MRGLKGEIIIVRGGHEGRTLLTCRLVLGDKPCNVHQVKTVSSHHQRFNSLSELLQQEGGGRLVVLQHELHRGAGGGQQFESLVVRNITEDLVINLYYSITNEDVPGRIFKNLLGYNKFSI